ncbi:MAG: alpha/beta fold hydrolase [Pseudanabaena sp. ELA607]
MTALSDRSSPASLSLPPSVEPAYVTKFWQWRDHQIAYTVVGQGLPLVLIHGFGASIGHWKNNISVWAAAGYQVYALDLLGFGQSDKPQLAYSLELWQELLQDFAHAHIPQRPCVWIGNSIGGLLALMLASDAPQLSLGAVLLNPASGLSHRPEELPPPLRLVMGAFSWLVSSELTGKFVFEQVRQKHRIRNTLAQVYRNRAAITDELVEMLYAPSCDAGAQQVFASILSAPAGPQPTDLLTHLEKPLLVLWGDADPWTPIKGALPYHQAKQAPQADRNPDIEIIPIPNTGHCPHDDRPEIVNALVLHWLSQRFSKPHSLT